MKESDDNNTHTPGATPSAPDPEGGPPEAPNEKLAKPGAWVDGWACWLCCWAVKVTKGVCAQVRAACSYTRLLLLNHLLQPV